MKTRAENNTHANIAIIWRQSYIINPKIITITYFLNMFSQLCPNNFMKSIHEISRIITFLLYFCNDNNNNNNCIVLRLRKNTITAQTFINNKF